MKITNEKKSWRVQELGVDQYWRFELRFSKCRENAKYCQEDKNWKRK